MRVLVVEDQPKIAGFVAKGLEEAGFTVTLRHTGEEGYQEVLTSPYDAMVLDIMLPGRDGLSILRSLRERHVEVPVILLTARNELNERVEGLNLGADDYLTKPFFVEELVARLKALMRRNSATPSNVIRVGDLSLDLVSREVRLGEEAVELSPREFSLLEYFMRSPGRVFARSQISQHVWNLHFDTGTNAIDVAVNRLRAKIDRGEGPSFIETVRGVGYRLRGEKE